MPANPSADRLLAYDERAVSESGTVVGTPRTAAGVGVLGAAAARAAGARARSGSGCGMTRGAEVNAVLYQMPTGVRAVDAASPPNHTTCNRLPCPIAKRGYSG